VCAARVGRRGRGQARVLLIGDAPEEVAGHFERLRGRRVERWTGTDPAALEARFRAGAVDEVGRAGRRPLAQGVALVGPCPEAALPFSLPLPLEPQSLPLPAPDVETVGNND